MRDPNRILWLGVLVCGITLWAQTPVITSVVRAGSLDSNFGPGTTLFLWGTFPNDSTCRLVTASGQLYPNSPNEVLVGRNGRFVVSGIDYNAFNPGTFGATLTVICSGQASNSVAINFPQTAPEFAAEGFGVDYNSLYGSGPPQIQPYYPFVHDDTGAKVTPASPASRGEILRVTVDGLGIFGNGSRAASPDIIVGGKTVRTNVVLPAYGQQTLSFAVPDDAPLGLVPVLAACTVYLGKPNCGEGKPVLIPIGSNPAISSVLNGASFNSSGTVAPGSIVSIFGAGFGSQDVPSLFPSTNASGTTVQFGNAPAPLFAVAATSGQINALVPTELSTTGTVDLTVKSASGMSVAQKVNLAPVSPGIFFYSDPWMPWRHNAVAVIANTSWIAMPQSMAAGMGLPTDCAVLGPAALCGQPAHAGDYLVIYTTGLGKATPGGDRNAASIPTGSVAPVSGNPLYLTVEPPTVKISGTPAPVLFSGVVPGYAGLYQVNVRVPDFGPKVGDDVPIEVSIGGVTDSATIAIERD